MTGQEQTRFRPSDVLLAVLGTLVAVVVGFLVIRQVLIAMEECEIGINASANFGHLLFFRLPILLLVLGPVFGLAFPLMVALARRLSGNAALRALIYVPVLAALVLGLGWAATLVVMDVTVSDDYPALNCPGNRPPWWPWGRI
ncbi:hypothetical protein [Amycolatopsis aidingensis]|uniref:hypothetical protein n=1 Tax=Amycolatopsis aidingensis TaxID=2842453 RepID=UPI001C0B70D9|nr:hypothetical protein [Amycolatopsis aidingensis]